MIRLHRPCLTPLTCFGVTVPWCACTYIHIRCAIAVAWSLQPFSILYVFAEMSSSSAKTGISKYKFIYLEIMSIFSIFLQSLYLMLMLSGRR